MNVKPFGLLLAAPLMMAGCMEIPLGNLVQTTNVVNNGHATLNVQVSIATASYATQAVVNPYSPSDINHVFVGVYRVTDSGEVLLLDCNHNYLSKDVPFAALNAPISFVGLNPNMSYRIRATAYQAPGTASADVISSETATASATDVNVTTEDAATPASVTIQMLNRVFNGQASPSLGFSSGGYTPVGSPSLQ